MTSIFSLFDWCNRRLHYPEKIILIIASSTLCISVDSSLLLHPFQQFYDRASAFSDKYTRASHRMHMQPISNLLHPFAGISFHFVLVLSWWYWSINSLVWGYHCKLTLSSLEYCLIIYPIPCFLTSNKMLNVFVYSTRCYSSILSSGGTGQVNPYSVGTTYY